MLRKYEAENKRQDQVIPYILLIKESTSLPEQIWGQIATPLVRLSIPIGCDQTLATAGAVQRANQDFDNDARKYGLH